MLYLIQTNNIYRLHNPGMTWDEHAENWIQRKPYRIPLALARDILARHSYETCNPQSGETKRWNIGPAI